MRQLCACSLDNELAQNALSLFRGVMVFLNVQVGLLCALYFSAAAAEQTSKERVV